MSQSVYVKRFNGVNKNRFRGNGSVGFVHADADVGWGGKSSGGDNGGGSESDHDKSELENFIDPDGRQRIDWQPKGQYDDLSQSGVYNQPIDWVEKGVSPIVIGVGLVAAVGLGYLIFR